MLDLGIEIVGLSYILFRQIHFIVDSMQGQIEQPTLLVISELSVEPVYSARGAHPAISGVPGILARLHFHRTWTGTSILKIYIRLFVGMIKIVLISAAFHSGYNQFLARLEQPGSAATGAAGKPWPT